MRLSHYFAEWTNFESIKFFFNYVYRCLSAHHVHVWYLLRSEEGVRCPETVLTDSCHLSAVT